MLVPCQRFGDLFLFGLVGQYFSVQTKYNKSRFKVMATYSHLSNNRVGWNKRVGVQNQLDFFPQFLS